MIKVLKNLSEYLNLALVWLAGLFLLGMIVLTCANISLRLVFKPVPGTFELMGFFGAVVGAFALGYTQIKKTHIAVDVLIDRFSARTRRILDVVNHAACLAFFILLTWQLFEKAETIGKAGEVTETLGIIYHPFIYAVAGGCAGLALVFACQLIQAVMPRKKEMDS